MHIDTAPCTRPDITMSPVPALRNKWLAELKNARFLRRCLERQATRSELATFVKQHYWYSRHFTRYLAALMSNLENEADRVELAHNLFDELGFGGAGDIPHALLYRNMMQAMDLECDPVPFPTTVHLADTMLTCCRSPNFLIGLGALCLGAESIVPEVYSAVVEGFRGVGEPLDNLVFFTRHIHCDEAHSATLQRIIERELAGHPSALTDLNYGAEKAIQARIRFFDGLLAH